MYQAQNSYFPPKFLSFLTDFIKKSEKKSKIFQARDLRLVPNEGKFYALSCFKILGKLD